MSRPSFVRFALACALLAPAIVAAAQAPATMQLPADQRAYNAARDTADPAARMAAYQAFLKNYPDSKRVDRARDAIFDLLLKNFPDRTQQIATLAKEQVKHGGKGNNHLTTESNVAEELAEAGPGGVDLKQASAWASDALKKLNEPAFDKEMAKGQKAYQKRTHAKPPTPEEQKKDAESTHRYYEQEHAGLETSVAAVDLAEDKLAEAQTALDDAYKTQPLDEDTSSLRGQLALKQGNTAAALDDFEQAEIEEDSNEEGLAPKWRAKLLELYRAQHKGSDAGLTATLDAEYAQLFPPPFAPQKQTPAPGGHTALLELFTGSACPPCVGGDLAAEGLLTAWPRSSLVVLAFDQHIPAPDPLANPSSAARAAFYKSHSTPNYTLDGQMLDVYGNDRQGAKEIYDSLETDVVKEAALPTDVHLDLTAERRADGDVAAKATVTAGPEAALAKEIVMPVEKPGGPAVPAPKPSPGTKPAPVVKPVPAPTPHLVANFALVEDDVRYSGQNGIRFHHYVVRSLAKPADSGFPVEPGASATLAASFDPKAISETLSTYLAAYAKSNDRFGPITFLSTDTAMTQGHLYVAAWVQDTATHRVLDAAIVPVAGEPAPSVMAAGN